MGNYINPFPRGSGFIPNKLIFFIIILVERITFRNIFSRRKKMSRLSTSSLINFLFKYLFLCLIIFFFEFYFNLKLSSKSCKLLVVCYSSAERLFFPLFLTFVFPALWVYTIIYKRIIYVIFTSPLTGCKKNHALY